MFSAAHEEEAQKNHKYPPQTRVWYHPQRPVWGTWEYPHLVSGTRYYLPAKQNYLMIIMMMVELAKILFGSNYSPHPIFHITTMPQNCEVAACIGNPIAVLCSHCVLCSVINVLCSVFSLDAICSGAETKRCSCAEAGFPLATAAKSAIDWTLYNCVVTFAVLQCTHYWNPLHGIVGSHIYVPLLHIYKTNSVHTNHKVVETSITRPLCQCQ